MEKTNETLTKLYQKFQDMQNSTPELKKVFKFSYEKLCDTPDICIEEISSYLMEHSSKIIDYRLSSHFDETTMAPILTLHMQLDQEQLKLMRSTVWDGIADKINSKLLVFNKDAVIHENDISLELGRHFIEHAIDSTIHRNIKNDVLSLLHRYDYEMNTVKTRIEMCTVVEQLLNSHGLSVKLTDVSTDYVIEMGLFAFEVNNGKKVLSLQEYLSQWD